MRARSRIVAQLVEQQEEEPHVSYDPNQAPGGGTWPAPGTPGGSTPPPTGSNPDPIVYGHDQPTVPHGMPGGPTAWVPHQQPAGEVPTVEVAPPQKGKGKGKVIGAVVGAVAVLAAGTFAVTAFAGGSDGGADSPEAAVEKMFESVGDLDVLGVMDSLLPGERDIMRDRAERLVGNLRDLGVLSEDADLGSVSGIEVTLSDMEYDPVETNVDDITNVLVSGTIDASVDGEALPIGDLIIDRFLDGEALDINESDSGEFEDMMITTVEEDGRWYVSAGYTTAEYARTNGVPDDPAFDIPAIDDAIALNGGDTPEAAITNLIDAVEGFDLEGIVGTLDPREFGALQRYAPEFIGEASDQFSDLQDEVSITFGDITYHVTRDGSTATVGLEIDALTVQFPEGSFEYRSDGNCITITDAGSEPEEMCAGELSTSPEDITAQLEELFPDDPELADAATALAEDAQAAFDDLGPLGITTSEVDGAWYVSVLGSAADSGLTVLDALDRDEFEGLIDDIEALAQAFEDSSMGGEFEIPGD
jgi:hypothetical protein